MVESSLDPMDNPAENPQVPPATSAELPKPGPKYLTTEQAAKVLNVSRPYVIALADAGTLKGVMRTLAKHRRISETEVLRMCELMHTQMPKAFRRSRTSTATCGANLTRPDDGDASLAKAA